MTTAEAEHHEQAIARMYRADFDLELHPLQTNPAVVPPRAVVDKVQGRSKSNANTFFGTGYRDVVRFIEELRAHGHDVSSMQRMLDMGFGTGRILLHFLPFHVERYGCDTNPAALEWTSKVLGQFADLRLSKPEPPLPFDSDFFDLILATSVFTHTPFAAQAGWIAELGRVLKPRGCVIATVHDFSKMAKQYEAIGWHEIGVERGLHMNTYITRPKLEEIWSAAFDVLEVRRYPPRQAHLIARRKSV